MFIFSSSPDFIFLVFPAGFVIPGPFYFFKCGLYFPTSDRKFFLWNGAFWFSRSKRDLIFRHIDYCRGNERFQFMCVFLISIILYVRTATEQNFISYHGISSLLVILGGWRSKFAFCPCKSGESSIKSQVMGYSRALKEMRAEYARVHNRPILIARAFVVRM